MITRFKMFEFNIYEPEIGDYVIANIRKLDVYEWKQNLVFGKITDIFKTSYKVRFLPSKKFKIPEDMVYSWVNKNKIIKFSKNREDLE